MEQAYPDGRYSAVTMAARSLAEAAHRALSDARQHLEEAQQNVTSALAQAQQAQQEFDDAQGRLGLVLDAARSMMGGQDLTHFACNFGMETNGRTDKNNLGLTEHCGLPLLAQAAYAAHAAEEAAQAAQDAHAAQQAKRQAHASKSQQYALAAPEQSHLSPSPQHSDQASLQSYQQPQASLQGYQQPQTCPQGYQQLPASLQPCYQRPQATTQGYQQPQACLEGYQQPQASMQGYQQTWPSLQPCYPQTTSTQQLQAQTHTVDYQGAGPTHISAVPLSGSTAAIPTVTIPTVARRATTSHHSTTTATPNPATNSGILTTAVTANGSTAVSPLPRTTGPTATNYHNHHSGVTAVIAPTHKRKALYDSGDDDDSDPSTYRRKRDKAGWHAGRNNTTDEDQGSGCAPKVPKVRQVSEHKALPVLRVKLDPATIQCLRENQKPCYGMPFLNQCEVYKGVLAEGFVLGTCALHMTRDASAPGSIRNTNGLKNNYRTGRPLLPNGVSGPKPDRYCGINFDVRTNEGFAYITRATRDNNK